MLLPKIGDLDRPLRASNLRLKCTSKKIRWYIDETILFLFFLVMLSWHRWKACGVVGFVSSGEDVCIYGFIYDPKDLVWEDSKLINDQVRCFLLLCTNPVFSTSYFIIGGFYLFIYLNIPKKKLELYTFLKKYCYWN